MASVESIPVTITGRIIGTAQGSESLMKGGDKRVYKVGVPHDKREILMDNGKPVREWYMRLAVSKSAVDAVGNQNGIQGMYEAIMKQASIFRPNGFQPDPKGGSPSNPKDYSLKFKDGDTGKTEDGELYSEKDYNKNSLLVEVSNRYAPKWLKRAEDGILEHCQEGDIKVGDHVAVSLLVGAGDSSVYLNLISVLLLKSGDRIGGDIGPKPEDAFAAFTKPSVAGTAAAVGNFGQAPQAQQPQFGQQPAATPQFGQPAQQPAAAPHNAVLPPAFQPQAQQAASPFTFPGAKQ